jgi:lysyl endopeptidase
LFDGTTHRIIGQLWGGGAACGNELFDEYGRFDVSFVNGLKPHLDPGKNGTLFVNTLIK